MLLAKGTAAARQRELERAIADTDQALALVASRGQQIKDIYAQSSSHTSKASTSIGSIGSA